MAVEYFEWWSKNLKKKYCLVKKMSEKKSKCTSSFQIVVQWRALYFQGQPPPRPEWETKVELKDRDGTAQKRAQSNQLTVPFCGDYLFVVVGSLPSVSFKLRKLRSETFCAELIVWKEASRLGHIPIGGMIRYVLCFLLCLLLNEMTLGTSSKL